MPVLPPSLAPEGRYYPKNICRALVGGNCVKIPKPLCLAWKYSRVHAGYSCLDTDIKTAATMRDDGIFLPMPRHRCNLWASYVLTDQLTLGGGVNAIGYIQSSAGVRAAGYATFALVAAYRITPRLQVELNVDKLFDRNDYTRVGGMNTFSIPGTECNITANLGDDFK